MTRQNPSMENIVMSGNAIVSEDDFDPALAIRPPSTTASRPERCTT